MNRLLAIFCVTLIFLSGCSVVTGAPAPAVPVGAVVQATPAPREQAAPIISAPAMKSPVVQEHSAHDQWIALIQLDGNVHLVNAATGWWKQATEDGNGSPQAGTSPLDKATFYCCMSWSSDGKLLAFRSTSVINNANGAQYFFSIGVYDAEHETVRTLLQNSTPGGLAFRPGTHLLAYDEVVSADYFASGQPDASKARGIMGLNIDTGEISELVKPEHGLWLSAPRWSPDGNVLGFQEQVQYEAPGNFALYDFQKGAYHAWNQAIGAYSFAPDGQHIAYDRMVRGMTAGSGRIWVSDLLGQGEQAFSPQSDTAARSPAWSPLGDQIAYLVGDLNAGLDQPVDVMVQPAAGGEPRKLVSSNNIGPLVWSPDGAQLAFSTGYPEEPHALLVTVANGHAKDQGIGYDPAWRPSGGQ